jgi:homopolymeric O-antigen transport system ATP-binding protein
MGHVTVTDVSKSYRYRSHRRAQRSSELTRASLAPRRGHFWALRDISLQVQPGEMFGLIGPNGAGKSTLLRLIGGVGRPNSGTIKVEGRIGSLLELGSDFNPELSGRENATISAIIAGLTRKEALARMESIIDFAELREFIDSPVRMYSSGMLLRLAFAIAVNTDPEVLLIDEVLAVGDSAFQRKCLGCVQDLRRDGCAIVLSTHDTQMAVQLCNEVMWLRKGAVGQVGHPSEVVAAYLASTDRETRRRTPADWQSEMTASGVELRIMENRFGSMELEITDVRLLDPSGFRVSHLLRGEQLRIEIDYHSNHPLPAPNFGVLIRKEDDTVLFDGHIPADKIGLATVQGFGSVALNFDRLDLNTGDYHIDVGVYSHDWAYAYDYHWRAYPLTVWAGSPVKGVVNPPHAWELSQPRKRRVR